MDDAQEKIRRGSSRRMLNDDAVVTTANRGSSGSGRTSASGRSSASGRANVPVDDAVAPSPTRETSRRAQPAGSARGSGVRKVDDAVPIAPTTSSRRGATVVRKKKPPMPMKEMLIAGAVVLVMFVVAMIVWMQKSGEQRKAKADEEANLKAFEANIERGKTAMEKANRVGALYVIGRTDDKFDDQSLFVPFKTDSNIINAFYERSFKDRRGTVKHEMKKMSEDIDRTTGITTVSNKYKEYPPDLTINYGFAQNGAVPVVIAKKTYKSAKDDVVNLGGVITVVVKAEDDKTFEQARNAPKKGEEKAAPPVENKAPAPAPDNKAPAPENKAPAPENKVPAPDAGKAPAPK